MILLLTAALALSGCPEVCGDPGAERKIRVLQEGVELLDDATINVRAGGAGQGGNLEFVHMHVLLEGVSEDSELSLIDLTIYGIRDGEQRRQAGASNVDVRCTEEMTLQTPELRMRIRDDSEDLTVGTVEVDVLIDDDVLERDIPVAFPDGPNILPAEFDG